MGEGAMGEGAATREAGERHRRCAFAAQ